MIKLWKLATDFLPIPNDPRALLSYAMIALIGWQYVAHGRTKVKLAQAETVIAQQQASIDSATSNAEAMVARSELEAQQHINELLKAENEAQRAATERAERQKQAELAAKWVARRKLEELRTSINAADWLDQSIPYDVRQWLQLPTGSAGGGDTESAGGSSEADSADDPGGVPRTLPGSGRTDRDKREPGASVPGHSRSSAAMQQPAKADQRIYEWCETAKRANTRPTIAAEIDGVLMPWPCEYKWREVIKL